MNFIHYGRDPDPKTVDVRMTALAAEGFTAASFGLSEHQLRHHLDPCHEPELFELWKMDQAGRIHLWEWLSAAHKATMPAFFGSFRSMVRKESHCRKIASCNSSRLERGLRAPC